MPDPLAGLGVPDDLVRDQRAGDHCHEPECYLDAAEKTLAEVSRTRRAFRLSATALHDRLTGLRLERGAAELDLELLAQRAVAAAVREARTTCVSSCPSASWTRRLAT